MSNQLLTRSSRKLIWIPLIVFGYCLEHRIFGLEAWAQVPTEKVESGQPPATQDRPFFGAFLKDVDDEQARELGVTALKGAVITRTTTNSPAAQAGLLPGDVIIACEGEPIDKALAFYRLFRNLKPSQKIKLTVLRGDQTLETSSVLTTLKMPVPQPTPTPSESAVEKPKEMPESIPGQQIAMAYTHPESIFRIEIPAGWQINYGMRGRVRQEGFDTLSHGATGTFMICPHKPMPGLQGIEGLEAFRLEHLKTLVHEEVQATGYSLSELAWMDISYISSESGQRVARLATFAPDGKTYFFMFVGPESMEQRAFTELKTSFQQAIRFTQRPTDVLTNKPELKTVPETALRLKNILQLQPRVVGLTAVSAGHQKAIELGIEAFAGAVVTEVHANTPAARAGMHPKDVIVQFGLHEVHTLEDCQAAIWTSPLNSNQQVIAVRGNQRLRFDLRIVPDETQRLVSQQYRHPTGGYQFNFLPRWKMHPNARRDERTKRVYDLIESEYGSYQIHLCQDRKPVLAAVDALYDFIDEKKPTFLDGSETGWCRIDQVPMAYVSGQSHRGQYTVYRIAFVIDGFLYEIDVTAPSLTDPRTLPLALQATLGSLKK